MNKMFRHLRAFFLPAHKLRVCFNPEMSYEKRHAAIFEKHPDGVADVVGITLNHPEVLFWLRKRHTDEIVRQARLCGYDPSHISTDTHGTRVWPLTTAGVEQDLDEIRASY